MKVYHKFLTIIMATFLLIVAALNIIIPDKDFSESENRVLKKRPDFSWDKLLKGKFTTDYEEYITDQFVFRDFWVSMKSAVEIGLHKKDSNGVYLGKDGYLLQKVDKIDKSILNKNIEAINTFAKDNPSTSMYFLLAPNSVEVLKEKLPKFAPHKDQLSIINKVKKDLNSKVKFVDVYNDLASHKGEYIYYKTDHHWTSLGAYYAYKNLALTMGNSPLNIDDFNIEEVTDKFYGTLYSKGNYRFINPDSIHIFKPKVELKYKVEYLDNGKSNSSLYELGHLEKKDKYSVFLDGNHALVTISTGANTGRKLLVLKDSYAHSLVPFLTNHYDEIHMIDLRYFNMDIDDYMKQFNLNEVLLLYNVSSFTEDNSIAKIKFK